MHRSLPWITILFALAAAVGGMSFSGPTLASASAVLGGAAPCYVCTPKCDDGTTACPAEQACTREFDQETQLYFCTQVISTESEVCDDVGENGTHTGCTPGSESTHCSEILRNACLATGDPSCTTSIDTCGTKYTCALTGALCPKKGNN
jgi:hypothetical protein